MAKYAMKLDMNQRIWHFFLLFCIVTIFAQNLLSSCKNCSQMVNWILVELKNDILFWFAFFFSLNENHLGLHMRHYLFLHYGWFLQNLLRGFIGTNMHTTVSYELCLLQKFFLEQSNYFGILHCYQVNFFTVKKG